jgi:hypothetical protein
VVSGRCLPYGVGITYWPVVGVVKRLNVLPSDPAAAAAIRSLLGELEAGTSAEEIAWAFRRLLEEQAPLVGEEQGDGAGRKLGHPRTIPLALTAIAETAEEDSFTRMPLTCGRQVA